MCLLFGQWCHIVRVVIDIDVTLEQLLLPERLITGIAFVRFLVRVDQHMGLKVPTAD